MSDPLCLNCGYNLRGNASGRCPECGYEFTPRGMARYHRAVHRGRSDMTRWTWQIGVAGGLLFMLFIPFAFYMPLAGLVIALVLLALIVRHNWVVASEVRLVRTYCSTEAGAEVTRGDTVLLWTLAMLFGEMAIAGAVATLGGVVIFVFFAAFS